MILVNSDEAIMKLWPLWAVHHCSVCYLKQKSCEVTFNNWDCNSWCSTTVAFTMKQKRSSESTLSVIACYHVMSICDFLLPWQQCFSFHLVEFCAMAFWHFILLSLIVSEADWLVIDLCWRMMSGDSVSSGGQGDCH